MYTLKDTNRMTYEEFGRVMESLTAKIESYLKKEKIRIDIVAPILRSGGVPGSILAIHFQVTKILPIQLKYVYGQKTTIKRLLSLSRILQVVPERPNILLCETNTSSGETAKAAVKIAKELYPKGKIYYATVAKVYGSPNRFEGVEEYFYGIQTNENSAAAPEEARRLGLRSRITIFPWEVAKHELADINAGS